MATLAQIRAGLQVRLATIDGLRALDYVPGGVTPPAAIVRLETLQYGTTQGEQSHDPVYVILVLVSRANDRTAQDSLDSYLDPASATSVLAAVNGDPTLGGIVDYAEVTSVRSYGNVVYGDTEYLGAELLVAIAMS